MSGEKPDFSQNISPESTQREELASPENAEHIPTEEEVRGVIRELIAKPFIESRKCEDEKGLYLLDVTITGEDEGETIEYSYIRTGRYPEGQASNTRIDKAIYQDGIPVGGEGVAELIEGVWKIFE